MNHSEKPVIAITGGSMGLGFALTKQLLESGFSVAMCARRQGILDSAVAALERYGEIKGFVGDVGDPYFRSTFVKRVVETFGRLDGLVNNASTLGDLPLNELSKASIVNLRRVFEVNAFAPVQLIAEALPFLQQQIRSVVVSISSDASIGGYSNWGVYGSSKAALDLFTKTFAQECAEHGPTFYAVDPSDMQTEMHEAAIPGDSGLTAPDDVARTLLKLFEPLKQSDASAPGAEFAYPSGSRLQVRGDSLCITGAMAHA